MKETFEEFKARLQKQYPKKVLVEKTVVENDKTVIKLFGYCKRIDGKTGMGLVGKYIIKSDNAVKPHMRNGKLVKGYFRKKPLTQVIDDGKNMCM